MIKFDFDHKGNPPVCSHETAFALYSQLEYYREYVPCMLKMPKEVYASTQEAINVDKVLQAYRDETGIAPTYPV